MIQWRSGVRVVQQPQTAKEQNAASCIQWLERTSTEFGIAALRSVGHVGYDSCPKVCAAPGLR